METAVGKAVKYHTGSLIFSMALYSTFLFTVRNCKVTVTSWKSDILVNYCNLTVRVHCYYRNAVLAPKALRWIPACNYIQFLHLYPFEFVPKLNFWIAAVWKKGALDTGFTRVRTVLCVSLSVCIKRTLTNSSPVYHGDAVACVLSSLR